MIEMSNFQNYYHLIVTRQKNEPRNAVNSAFLGSCTYTIEKVEITSTFDEHMIPADYIYALGEEGDKNNPTVILVHGLGGNRYTNYPFLIVSV